MTTRHAPTGTPEHTAADHRQHPEHDQHTRPGRHTPQTREEERGRGLRVVDAFYRALRAGDTDAFARLWTDDAVYQVPVTPDGVPGEFTGRETIVAGLGGFFALFGQTRLTWQAHLMDDPHKVLATWDMEIELLAGGTYRNRGASLFELEGERIARFSEHVDTAAFLDVFARPAHTARRLFTLLHGTDTDAFAGLWHEHATATVPYPLKGAGSLLDGRDAITGAYRRLREQRPAAGAEITAVHPCAGGDTVCVQYRIRTAGPGGRAVREGVAVLGFTDGLISSCRDYTAPRRPRTPRTPSAGGR